MPSSASNRYDTEGFAMDVAVRGDQVFVAEEEGGLSVWRTSNAGTLELLGRYRPGNRVVRRVSVPAPGNFAVLQLDMSLLDFVDVSDPAKPASVFMDRGHGFVYDIADELDQDACLRVLWQLHGVFWYSLTPEPGAATSSYRHRLGDDGMVTRGDEELVIYRGGWVLVGPGEPRPPSELPLHRLAGTRVVGKPVLDGDTLHVSCRTTGDISIVDLSDPGSPALLEHLTIPGNPGRIAIHNKALVIPNGYQGLWIRDDLGREIR